MNYSVLLSVYYKDKPEYLEESINSILMQTVKTNDFVIVKDGKLTKELDKVINKYQKNYKGLFNIVDLPKNVGLGKALAQGITKCKNEWIARMDADDISFPTRIEEEIKIIKKNPEISLIGTQAIEFIESPDKTVNYNDFPLSNEEIIKYAHSRNPFSHSAIMFKKSAVLDVGNYQDVFLCEDYDLWIRFILKNYICANVKEYLHAVLISEDFFMRRGGLKYVKSIHNLMYRNYKKGFFTKKDYCKNICIRSVVYLMPNKMRAFFYKTFLRKKEVYEN